MESIIKFWRLAARLKVEERRGWRKLGLRKVESVADHSFGLAMLAFFEGERRRNDVEQILKLALIHDLGEAITGDLTPEDKSILGATRVRREREKAMRRLADTLPPKSRKSFLGLWTDLNVLKSREARLVHQLDKVEMALQAREYQRSVGRMRVLEFYKSASKETTDEALKRVLSHVTRF